MCESANFCLEPMMRSRNIPVPVRRGFTIVEAVVATLVVGVMLAGAVSTLSASRLTRARVADRARGQQLALDLINEILQLPYQDPIQTPVFGLEPGESATSRAAWNDVDDYNGWTESPPQSKSGTVYVNCGGWTRSVLVEWIDPTTLAATQTANTGIKRITVTVKKGSLVMATVAAYRSLGWVDTVPKPTDATGNHPPTASATGTALSGKAPLTATLNGSGSSDVDGNTLSYVWAFGDGTTGSGAILSHTYTAVGTYTATLTVYDGRGGVGISSVTVTATP
jgi:PKD repeat protein